MLMMCPSYFSGKRSHQSALNTEGLLSSVFLIQCHSAYFEKFLPVTCDIPSFPGCGVELLHRQAADIHETV